MNHDTPDPAGRAVPPRRVAMTVTAYLTGHLGGFYDLQSHPDGGEKWSVPEYCVDEHTVTDLPPETLTRDDWNEIAGTVAARLGALAGGELAAAFKRLAADQFGQGEPAAPRCAHQDAAARARRLADHWARAGGAQSAVWRQASMDLHAALDAEAGR